MGHLLLLGSLKANKSSPSFNGLSFDQLFMKLMNSWVIGMPWILRRTLKALGTKTHIPPLVPWLAPRQIPISFALLSLLLWLTSTMIPKGACRSAKKLNFSPVMISAGALGVVLELGGLLWLLIILNAKRSYRAFGRVYGSSSLVNFSSIVLQFSHVHKEYKVQAWYLCSQGDWW